MGEDGGARTPHEPTALQKRIPNALTWSRVVMTVAFVAVLSVYRFPDVNAWALPVGLVLFVVAALTDAADGYLARKWNAVSVFGRIVDPLADKVLVLGAFIMLAGPGFMGDGRFVSGSISGVVPWMVVVILARELLVTTMRGALEGKGIDFSAVWSGKVKMIAQSVGVPLILLVAVVAEVIYDNPFSRVDRRLPELDKQKKEALAAGDVETYQELAAEIESVSVGVDGMGILKEAVESASRVMDLASIAAIVAWVITILTAVSVVPYVTRAMRLSRAGGGDG